MNLSIFRSKPQWMAMAVVLLLVPALCSAIEAEMIWSDTRSSGSRILFSHYKNDQWEEPQTLAETDKFSLLPAIGSNEKGRRLAVWVEFQANGTSRLAYRFYDGGYWGDSGYLPVGEGVNMAPVIVFAFSENPFVFWSHNTGDDDDDIIVSRWNKGRWEMPTTIHEENDVPDVLPEAGLDENGLIWVCWQCLDTSGLYVEKCLEITPSGETRQKQMKRGVRQASDYVKEIKQPFFKMGKGRATVHFPEQRQQQSTSFNILEE